MRFTEVCSALYNVQVTLKMLFLGSPWGAGTFASSAGTRQPSKLELEIAEIQGSFFYETLSKAFRK